MLLGVSHASAQSSITTVFTLPTSTDSDWNLPQSPLKALFVFPTYFPVQFSRCVEVSSIPFRYIRSFKTIQYFIGVRNIRFVGSSEPLTAPALRLLSLRGICTALLLHPHSVSFVRMLDLGCESCACASLLSP